MGHREAYISSHITFIQLMLLTSILDRYCISFTLLPSAGEMIMTLWSQTDTTVASGGIFVHLHTAGKFQSWKI